MTEPRPPVPSTGPAGSAQIPDELLSAYLDNAVSESERAAVERALAQDPEVVWRLDTLRQTVLLLKALPLPVLPRSFALESILAEAAAGETIFQGSALAGGPGPAAVARSAVGSSALSGTHIARENRAPGTQPAAAQRERAPGSWGERWRAFWQAGSPLLRNAAAVSFALFLVVLAGGQMLTLQRPPSMEAAASMEDAAGLEPAAIAEGPAAEAPAAVAGASALQKEATPTAAASAAAESAPAAESPAAQDAEAQGAEAQGAEAQDAEAQGAEAQGAEADAGATAPTAFALSDEAPLVESAAAGSEDAAETMVEAPAAAPAAAAEAPAEEAVDGTIVESAAAESAAPLAAAPAPAPLAGSELLAETPLAPADDSALGLGGMGGGIGGMGGGAPASEQGLGSALNLDALDGAAQARQSAPEAPAADSAPAAAARAAEESAAEGAAVEETSDQQMYATAASAEAPAATATAAPTPAPTPMPTAVPTLEPTAAPTAAPTEQVVAALPPARTSRDSRAELRESPASAAAAPASAAARSPLLLLTWGLAGLSFALLLLWLRSRSRLQRD